MISSVGGLPYFSQDAEKLLKKKYRTYSRKHGLRTKALGSHRVVEASVRDVGKTIYRLAVQHKTNHFNVKPANVLALENQHEFWLADLDLFTYCDPDSREIRNSYVIFTPPDTLSTDGEEDQSSERELAESCSLDHYAFGMSLLEVYFEGISEWYRSFSGPKPQPTMQDIMDYLNLMLPNQSWTENQIFEKYPVKTTVDLTLQLTH